MKTFATNDNNDLYVGPMGSLVIVSDLAALVEVCEAAAQVALNEMIFAQGQGLPYFEAVWIGVPNLALFEAAYRQRILAVEGVTDILSFEPLVADGVMRYTATLQTVYGTGQANG